MNALSERDYIDRINLAANSRYSIAGWVGGFAKYRTRAAATCNSCGNSWETSIASLMNGSGCPDCSPKTRGAAARLSESECITRINKPGLVSFVRWEGAFKGTASRVTLYCHTCKEEKTTGAGRHINKGGSCATCNNGAKGDDRRANEQDRIEQINSMDGVTFTRWHKGYRNLSSKAVCRCPSGHEWAASIKHLTTSGSKCPKCAKYGFKPSSPGSLYVLESECGKLIKVGITNSIKSRMSKLKRVTPFRFKLTNVKDYEIGSDAMEAETTIHSRLTRAFYDAGFDGHTEWFIKTDSAQLILKQVMT